MAESPQDYSKTVHLPETAFPMKAGLAESEPERLKKWEAEGAYQALRSARAGRPMWVLHDGPPFANGDIHMGTALNKILKDIVVRYRSMQGFDAPYVPGWDCHGLPIEFKVAKALGAEREKKNAREIRELCAKEAMTYVERQRGQFKRLGVRGDWENPYLTLDPKFEAAQFDVYWKLLSSGQIYRGLKPVHWCVYDQTALADAELEYKEHASTAVYVKFELEAASAAAIAPGKKVFAIIWTTTPWTLPANLAITANERFDYAAYDVDGEIWLVAQGLASRLFEALQRPVPATVWQGRGSQLEDLAAKHPFIERSVRFCCASYVTLDTGTGLVHTAPGHGTEDYVTGSRYKLDILCPVDAQGRYTDKFELMKGKRVTDPETNQIILELLKEKGALIHSDKLEHSYPHCWRCKNPVIFRATEQWFMSLENNGLRTRVLEETKKVQWVTPGGAERFANMMKDRADWCISRQRTWGMPIYMYYCASCKVPHFDEACYKKLRPMVEKEGGDAWFDPARKIGDFLPAGAACAKCGSVEFKMERDTLDVWFDSGSSSSAVLKANPAQHFPAELYVEASDQYRGWFQSSMLVSCGVHGQAPYKAVLSHGWMLDAKGQPMHKSLGNVVDPVEVMKRYGADILRLWVSSENVLADLHFGEEILKSVAENYRRLRNSFRWLLGNLKGFDPAQAVPLPKLEPLDRWLLSQLSVLISDCGKAMDAYELQKSYSRLQGFCSFELSSLVFDIHKDTLYTLAPKDPRRLSAQTALYETLSALTRLAAPVLAFTSEEVWDHMDPKWKDSPSVHLALWPEARPEWRQPELEAEFDLIFSHLMPVVKKRLEEARAAKVIGHPYDAKVLLKIHSKKLVQVLLKYEALIPSLFIVSELALERVAPQDGLTVTPEEVEVSASQNHKCARCWRRPGDVAAEGGVCGRCKESLA
jgi:isoleucyl-tRNA synthetase